MEDGLAGVPGLAVISAVVAAAPFGLAPALVPLPRMVGRSAKERRTRSSRATPNPVVSDPVYSLHDPTLCKHECSLIQHMVCLFYVELCFKKVSTACDQQY